MKEQISSVQQHLSTHITAQITALESKGERTEVSLKELPTSMNQIMEMLQMVLLTTVPNPKVKSKGSETSQGPIARGEEGHTRRVEDLDGQEKPSTKPLGQRLVDPETLRRKLGDEGRTEATFSTGIGGTDAGLRGVSGGRGPLGPLMAVASLVVGIPIGNLFGDSEVNGGRNGAEARLLRNGQNRWEEGCSHRWAEPLT